MKLTTFDNEVLHGTTSTEIVEVLRNGSRFASDQSLEVFMKGMAARWEAYSGQAVRFDTPDNFIEDLKLTGYIVL